MIKTGDIGLCSKPVHWYSKLIASFDNGYNHSFILTIEFGKVYVYEMVKFGIKRTLFSDFDKKVYFEIYRYKKSYNRNQENAIITFLLNTYMQHPKYDFKALLKHLYFKVTNHFIKDNNKKYICSELCAMAANIAEPFTFCIASSISPYDISINPKYEKL